MSVWSHITALTDLTISRHVRDPSRFTTGQPGSVYEWRVHSIRTLKHSPSILLAMWGYLEWENSVLRQMMLILQLETNRNAAALVVLGARPYSNNKQLEWC